MNTKLTLLLLAAIGACYIAARSLAPESAEATRPAVYEAPAIGEDFSPGSQALTIPDAGPDVDTPATELVMGIVVRKDRNCTVQRHYVDLGNGTVTEAFSCVPDEAVADDYDQYSDEELRVLSYSDARAASMLGKRLVEVDPERAQALLLRAVALQPANLDPVMWLAAQAHSVRGDSAEANEARANTYVLTRTAQAMGSSASVDWIVADLESAGFEAVDIAGLEEQVKGNLLRIRNIQLEVFGESVVGEVLL